jgi:hypothetical protein
MDEQTKDGTPDKSKKTQAVRLRSPNYPAIKLEEALALAKKFYDFEKRNSANYEIALKHWGFKAGSGLGGVVLAALKAFGLIAYSGSGQDKKVQLTDLALRILLDTRQESPDRDEAIKQAALMPTLHSLLWNKYRTDLPSDENLRHELIFTLKFNERVVNDFIGEYKSTINYAKLSDSDTISPHDGDKGEEPEMIVEEKENVGVLPKGTDTSPKTGGQNNRPIGASIPVTKDCQITIMANGPVTKKGLDQLRSYLELIRDSFPDE